MTRKVIKKAVKKATKKACKKAVTKSKAKAPAVLHKFWTPEVQAAWASLALKRQMFLLEWMSNRFNGRQAYAKVYGHDISGHDTKANNKKNLCGVEAFKILNLPNVLIIRKAILSDPVWEIEKALDTFTDIMHNGSNTERMIAAKAHIEQYEKHKALDVPLPAPEPTNVTNNNTQVNFYLTESMENVKKLLNNKFDSEKE